MKNAIQIGSQIFINKNDTPEQVREWVRQLWESKMTLIRLFVSWDHIEPLENIWDFTNYDACFNEAEKLGLEIIPTLMSVSPPCWMNITGGMQDLGDLDDEVFWERSMQYVRKVVERYYRSPAMNSWILWNEPSRVIVPNEKSMNAFREYLRQVYNNDIDKINKLYFNKFSSFEQIGEKKAENTNSLDFKGYAETLDWTRFSVHNLCEKLMSIKTEIRKFDNVHPVHVNPHNIAQNLLHAGQSIWHEAEITDFLGCSAHPSWHSTRFPQDRIHQSVAYYADLMKSVTLHPEGKFWVTELQGGTNIFSGVNYLCPTGNDIKHWVWESLGTGAQAVIFWCFNSRTSGFEGGEWGLLNQNGKPSERLKAATEVVELLNKNNELFSGVKPRKPDVWLLYSENTWALGEIEGQGYDVSNPRNKLMGADALCGAYLMLSDLGYEVGFINEKKLSIDGLKPGSVLVLPGATSLLYETCIAVRNFVNEGGTLLADGLCGMKDENGFISKGNKKLLDEVFGAKLEDIEASNAEFPLLVDSFDGCLTGWFIKCSFEETKGIHIPGRFENGKPAVIVNNRPAGKAARIGTTFFQQYLIRPKKEHLQFLRSLLPDINTQIRHLNPAFDLRMKVLEAQNEGIMILLNKGAHRNIEIMPQNDIHLKGLNFEYEAAVAGGKAHYVPIKDSETLIMYWSL